MDVAEVERVETLSGDRDTNEESEGVCEYKFCVLWNNSAHSLDGNVNSGVNLARSNRFLILFPVVL